jgi:hypothetical protein
MMTLRSVWMAYKVRFSKFERACRGRQEVFSDETITHINDEEANV